MRKKMSEIMDKFPNRFLELLNSRGFRSSESIIQYLYALPKLKDPILLPNVGMAAKVIHESIINDIPIFIHGDFDVDGIVATSIVFSVIYHDIGYKHIIPYIPSRVDEGYGLTESSLTQILNIFKSKYEQEKRKPLLITVDCGIKDKSLIDNKWYEYFDFIVTDHHKFLEDEKNTLLLSNKAKAIVHAKLPGSQTFQEICGATTIYKVCEILLGLYNRNILNSKNIEKYIPFISLATNCDVMPLVEENRSIMKIGLDSMRKYENAVSGDHTLSSLYELAAIAGVDLALVSTYDLGFKIGPRINAAGRLGSALDAVRLLVSRDIDIVKRECDNLSKLNAKRQELTLRYLEEAESQITKNDYLQNKILVIRGTDWEEGIVGLVAGKLCEKYHRPVIVLSIHSDEVVGSCRSINKLDIVSLLTRSQRLLTRFGGHAQAAGLAMKRKKIDEFEKEVVLYANKYLSESDIQKVERYDINIEISEIDTEFFELIKLMEPFGYGNPIPIFKVSGAMISNMQMFGKDNKHLKFILKDKNKSEVNCIYWGGAEILSTKNIQAGKEVIVFASIELDSYWNRLQLNIKNIYLMDK